VRRGGLAGAAATSFRSFNYPARYLRHRDFHLWLRDSTADLLASNDDLFRKDATFKVVPFLEQARSCRYSDDVAGQEAFEAYMEAAIIFGRIAIQRLRKSADRKARNNPSLKAEVKAWWGSLEEDPSIKFFRSERNFIVHEGPLKVGQRIGLDASASEKAEAYYYESPDIPVTDTIERHLNSVEEIVTDVEGRFSTSSLSGEWWKDLERLTAIHPTSREGVLRS
jgi:hypothetical protein